MANYGKRNGKQPDGMGTKNNNNRVKEKRKPLYYPYFVCYSAAPANATSFLPDDDGGNKANECD
jgi:hypothetical protein